MAVQTRGGAASRAVVVDVQGNGQLPADQPRTLPAGGGTVWVKNGRPKVRVLSACVRVCMRVCVCVRACVAESGFF